MQDREARRKLHNELIDKQGLPCARCGATKGLVIHRIVPGFKGGKYTRRNVQVLCRLCHQHPQAKFSIGDRVYLNGRCPQHIPLTHHRPRTIIEVSYSPEKQCSFYLLGEKGVKAGFTRYMFRSYMLHSWPMAPRVGRPREKRKYNGKQKCLAKSHDSPQSPLGDRGKGIASCGVLSGFSAINR